MKNPNHFSEWNVEDKKAETRKGKKTSDKTLRAGAVTKDNTEENSSAKIRARTQTDKKASQAKTVSLKTSKSYDSDTYFFFMCVYGLGFSWKLYVCMQTQYINKKHSPRTHSDNCGMPEYSIPIIGNAFNITLVHSLFNHLMSFSLMHPI